MPPLHSILSGEHGFAVVVSDFGPAERRKAARLLWEAHVTSATPFSSIREFTQLVKAGEEKTFFRYSEADDRWGELWGEGGDLREEPLSVFWYLDDDIPGRACWGEE